jgi:hemerythrin-like domain-containing protein
VNAPNKSLVQYLTDQHREADGFWAEVENAAGKKDAAGASAAFERFDRSMRQHLAYEEEVLFPEFEQATGMVGGPTMVMRAEHKQMRALLDQLRGAVTKSDHAAVLDVGDTLFTLIAQHNMKEEGMLYRMSEQALGLKWTELWNRAKTYE